MQAVILAAGEGLRMRPLTHSMPKVMLRVANKPILEYVIESLVKQGIDDIVMVVGYKKEQIMTYFEDGKKWGVRIRYAIEGKQLGTAHALSKAKGMVDGPFIVYPGDNIIDQEALSLFLEKSPKDGSSLLVVPSARPAKYGVVVTSGNRIEGIRTDLEARVGNIISTGIYHFTPEIFSMAEEALKEGVYTLTDLTLRLIKGGKKIDAVVAPGRWIDAVHPWDLLDACETSMCSHGGKLAGTISQKSTIIGAVSVGEDTIIREGCYIEGPVIIGRGCEIGPNVVITPSTSIGDNVKIEPYVKIEQSIIMDDVSIGPFSCISHSVIASGVVIEGHFATAVGNCHVETPHGFKEVDEIGAIIGEDTVIGFQTSTLPGTVVGANCRIDAFKRISGNIPNDSRMV